METLTITTNNGISELTLNRPSKLNAMNALFFEELPHAIETLEHDPATRVIIVRANGPHFSAGLDLHEMAPGSQAVKTADDIEPLQRGFASLATVSKPTLAAVHGYCIGGGLDLAAACDWRLATQTAIFSLREVRIGIVADLGSLSLLADVLPYSTLAEIALTGRDITADEAKQLGLVQSVHPSLQALQAATLGLANRLAANPPLAVQATKRLLVNERRERLGTQLARAAEANVALMRSDDAREALRAFQEHREPRFQGR
jgi:enoyl-CoA hydratase